MVVHGHMRLVALTPHCLLRLTDVTTLPHEIKRNMLLFLVHYEWCAEDIDMKINQNSEGVHEGSAHLYSELRDAMVKARSPNPYTIPYFISLTLPKILVLGLKSSCNPCGKISFVSTRRVAMRHAEMTLNKLAILLPAHDPSL